jgi:hypothetical protein
VLDKERLKNGAFLSKEYYENLLAEIREIRASERRFYQKLDAFLQFNQRDLLDHPGKVTTEIAKTFAKTFAESEFEKYRVIQDRLFESDFDRMLKQLPLQKEDQL